jgi:apolipoprotein D and lipocalin family protein
MSWTISFLIVLASDNFRRLTSAGATALAALVFVGCASASPVPPVGPAPTPLATLDVKAYMGRWYQAALYPNRFQRQCVANTSAVYRLLENNTVEVTNACTTASGQEQVVGQARPRDAALQDGRLNPASLEVAFAPSWLRWLPVVWGNYDVLAFEADGTVAIVGEASRTYLWVLSRSPTLSQATWAQIDATVTRLGYDVQRLKREPQGR